MASNINPYNVDGTFPVAGQDNPSQGFRDNFTNIKNNFTFAQTEISDLQAKALVTSALSGQTINNDMAGTQIIRPQLSAWTQSLLDLGVVATTATLDFSQANFQKITTAAPISISFINWPASTGTGALGYGVMRVWINVTDVSHTVTLPVSVSIAATDIAGYNSANQTITFDAPGDYIFDFSSIDGGTTYQIFDVVRNRSTFRDPELYFNAEVNSTFLIGYGAALPVALALEQGEDKVSVAGSYNSVSSGSNSMGNIFYTQTDNGPGAGYSISSFRGNLNSINPILPVQNNDFLGYVNNLSITGNGAGNAITTMSSIGFYATGTNVVNGLGGNIALFTAPDQSGSQSFLRLRQAVSVNPDQSVKFFGNTETAGIFKTDNTIIEGGTYVTNIPTIGGSFAANSSISTIIVNSTGSNTIAWANITLPANPLDRQKIKIVSVAPITLANVNAPNSATVLYVPTNKFQSGNTSVQLTYISSYGSWYVS
jgi:hypothetical protein